MSRTPTTDDIRHEYAVSYVAEYQQEARAEFDRWLAEFDRWLAEHDAALIEGLAEEVPAADANLRDDRGWARWLHEKARQRREEQS